MNTNLFPWLFPATIATAIVEMILSSTWNMVYFTHGIPIFRRSYVAIPGRDSFPSVKELEDSLRSRFSQSVVFKQFGAHEYAFREKAFEFTLFHGTPVMHGLLRWHPESGTVTVVGYANWFIIIFSLLWLSMVGSSFDFFIIFFVLLMALLYIIQARRFEKVGKIASEKWLKA